MTRHLLTSLALVALTIVPSDVSAQVFAKVGTFTKPTSTGNQTINVGFPPEAVWIWTVLTTSTGLVDGYNIAFGFAACGGTDTGDFGYSVYIVGTDDTEVLKSIVHMEGGEDATIARMNPAATSVADRAQLASCDSTSFTLNWTHATATAHLYGFAVLGGPDVTAKVKHANTGTGAATRAITGLGIEPQFLMALSLFSAISPNFSVNAGNIPGIGATDCTRQGQAATALDDESNPSNTHRLLRTDRLTAKVNDNGSVSPLTTFVSCDEDGWTWTVSNHTTNGVGALGLRVPQVYVSNATKPTSDGSQTLTATGVTNPKLVFLWSVSAPSDSNVQDGANLGFGASDGTNSVFFWAASADNVSPTVSAVELNTTAVLKMADPAATAASSTTLGLATVTSFGSEQVGLNWSDSDSTARQFLYAVFGGDDGVIEGPAPLSPFIIGDLQLLTAVAVALTFVARRRTSTRGDARAVARSRCPSSRSRSGRIGRHLNRQTGRP